LVRALGRGTRSSERHTRRIRSALRRRIGLLGPRLASSTFPGLASTLLAESAFDAILTVLLISIAIGLGFAAGVPGSAFVLGPVAQHPLIATFAGSGLALAGGC
jgi:hypothetical protein